MVGIGERMRPGKRLEINIGVSRVELLPVDILPGESSTRLLGHASGETTQIYTHVMRKPGLGVRSPFDTLRAGPLDTRRPRKCVTYYITHFPCPP